jgi:TonB-linked SusC/RagA family outer membrane protein
MRNSIISKPVRFLLLFVFIPFWISAQNVSVTGTVKDKNGEALIGVSVVEQGTTHGAVTDLDGQYSLNAANNATLQFSYIGYVTQSIVLKNVNGGGYKLDVVLLEDTKALSEVVVIGYGTQRREAVTGSVASMNGDNIRAVAATNVAQALQGRIAGVDMQTTDSRPGAEMQIRIRGTRSLGATNDPLIVLDGIPFNGSLSDINPNDIKSMDILKDASSTAIYGSRGANGVLLITTNRGQTGQKARVAYNGYFGAREIFSKYDMMDGPKYAEMRAYANLDAYKNNTADEDAINTDWQDLFFKKGTVQSHDIAVSGGTESSSYNFGIGYYNDEGVVPLEGYQRLSLRGSLDQKVGIFKLGFTTNTNYNVIERRSSGGLYQVLQMSPILNPYKADGSWKRTVDMPADKGAWVYTRDVIEANKDNMLNQTRGLGTYNNVYAEVNAPWVEGLKYRVNVGLNLRMSTGGSYTGQGINNASADNPSSGTVTNRMNTNWAVENLLTYDRTFADVHQVNAVAMYSAEETLYNRSQMAARGVASNFQWWNLGRTDGERTIDPTQQEYQKYGLESWMARVMYSYDNRYMISAALRNDKSSRLAPGHQGHTYPAVSVGWNVNREKFMENADWLDNLKVRIGYGETSNQAIDPYQTRGSLGTRPYNFGDANTGFITGTYVSTSPNDQLGWEYSTTWNYGIDFSLFHNRLYGTAEYYITDTKDVLLPISLPVTSGVTSYMANAGNTQNKGFELSLNGVILDNLNGWTWTAGVNFYTNKNKIVSLASGELQNIDQAWFVGSPINVIYAPKYAGLWQEGDPYMNILEPQAHPGDIKIEYLGDYNDDGSPKRALDGGGADRQVIEVDPNFLGGFNTSVSYKGFDLSIIGAFKQGGQLISSLYAANGYLNMLTGRRGQVDVDYWTPENTGARYPKPGGLISGDNPKYGNTLALFDASYLKVRTITLGYTFNQPAIKNLGISNLRLYASVLNPFVLFAPYTKQSGMDPETNSYGSGNNANSAVTTGLATERILTIGTNTPSTRSYLVGLNLTF